jgi:fatty-acid desaturase
MMKPVFRINGQNKSPLDGHIVLDWQKTIWNGGTLILALLFAPITFSWDALLICFLLTYFMLLIGHSVGMHRMMIHKTFKSPKWFERVLIYVGVLVGMSGPFGILKIHDTRDWAQRQKACHDFFSHKRGYIRDLTWQLFCRFEFTNPPKFLIEPDLADDVWYSFFEKTWRFHQIILAIPLYYFGGWSWVVWGIIVRVPLSVIGHWSITYICHNPGPGRWQVKDAAVQASNLPGMGILTYGECWHNNHHAFPESARIGLEKGQCDPSWRFIQVIAKLGLAHNIGQPRSKSDQDDLLEMKSV